MSHLAASQEWKVQVARACEFPMSRQGCSTVALLSPMLAFARGRVPLTMQPGSVWVLLAEGASRTSHPSRPGHLRSSGIDVHADLFCRQKLLALVSRQGTVQATQQPYLLLT